MNLNNQIIFKLVIPTKEITTGYLFASKTETLYNEFNKTKLFKYYGRSRIDNSPIFSTISTRLRKSKIDKIRNIHPTYIDKVEKILSKYNKYIHIINYLT